MSSETGPKPKDTTLLVCFRELGYGVSFLAGGCGFVLPFLVCFFFLESKCQSRGDKKRRKEKPFALQC